MIFLELEREPGFPEGLLEKAARTTLHHTKAGEADLTLVLTGDEEIRILNRDFLGTDVPTDVLSFPADETDPETGHHYLGDVIISLPRAAEQAARGGHSLADEVQLLVVHGVLHLLGYDHAEADEKRRMWGEQMIILKSLNLAEIKFEE